MKKSDVVLIPLLVDDPLWVKIKLMEPNQESIVLIPLLVDDPLWAANAGFHGTF